MLIYGCAQFQQFGTVSTQLCLHGTLRTVSVAFQTSPHLIQKTKHSIQSQFLKVTHTEHSWNEAVQRGASYSV